MLEIKNFFEKFLKLHKNNIDIRKKVVDVIFDVTKIKISESDLEIKENSIYLKCKPIYRNEIFMHKKEIEDFLMTVKIFSKII